jgi:hypothetical protein
LGYDQKLNVITSDSLSSNSYLTPTMQNNYQQSPRGNQARVRFMKYLSNFKNKSRKINKSI